MTTIKLFFSLCLLMAVSLSAAAQDQDDQSPFSDLSAMAPLDRLTAMIDQARMAERAGNPSLALAFYREAETLTPALGETGAKAFLIIKYRELALEAVTLDWRRVEHRFEDLRKIADQHPLWTESQLERALAETEIRLRSQPEDDDKEGQIRLLHKEVMLIVQSMGDSINGRLLARARELGYALEDTYGKRDLLP